tara:strand:+ start:471 stop:716 length:246 start_codon:yes stop_codon:yes gene_type:complete
METIHLDDFLNDGILKEEEFRRKVQQLDWTQYNNKKVLIKGCTKAPVPIWSYLIVTAELSQHAKLVFFGEPCSLVKIYDNN